MLEEEGDLLTRWRARLVAAFLCATGTMGIALVLSTIGILARDGQWPLVALDTVLIIMVYWLLLSRRVTNQHRSYFLTIGSWLIGTLAIITLGPFSTALGWLYTSVFLSAFLLGRRATIAVVASILLLLLLVAIGIASDALVWAVGDPTALSQWIMLSTDFTFLVIVFAGANTLTIQLLRREDQARVRAEQQLAEGRRHQALGTLASGIAHDFNNLLVPMLSNVELAREALPAEGEAHKALGDAQRSAERARDLVQRILAFGRGVDSQRQAMDVSTVVRETVELIRSSVPATVTFNLTLRAAHTVMASRAELHQILHNLLSNAFHAIPSSGQITVTVDEVDDVLHRWVRLRVSDTGAGMEPAVRDRIFDPYFTTREGSRGTGLGLPIVRSIIESMGGSIVAESQVGQGSTFSVLLPAVAELTSTQPAVGDLPSSGRGAVELAISATEFAEPAQSGVASRPAAPAPVSAGEAPHQRHVLLVEDEESVRRATARQLTALGYTVTVAESASEALTLFVDHGLRFDLLLTDHRMPGGTGRELADAVWRRDPELRVVLMSGDVADALGDDPDTECLTTLQKPFSRAELAKALAEALPRSVTP